MAGSAPVPAAGPGSRFLGWRVLILATITGALTGPGQTIGVSVFIDHFIADLALTRSQVSTAYLAGTLLGALSLPAVGRWIDRVGARSAMSLIGVFFGAALVAMWGVGGFVTLALGFSLIRLLGQGSLMLVSTVAVTHWFDRRRGLALGVMSTTVSVLMALVPVGLNWVIENYGWRTAWLVAGIAVWAIVVPIARLGIVDRPESVGQVPDGTRQRSSERSHLPSWTRPEAMRTAPFWILSGASAAAAMLVTALTFHQISLLGEIGLSSTAAAAMFLPQVIGATIAGLVFGALADRLSGRLLLAGAMLLLAGATVLAWLVAAGWLVVAYAIVLGAAGGAIRSSAAALLPRWYGTGAIGSIQGFVTFLSVAASATGPVVLSVARTVTGQYSSAALVATAIPASLALLAGWLAGDPQRGSAVRQASSPA